MKTCGVDARTDARRPADGQFPFFTAPSLKRVLRGSLVSLAITAVYKGETGEAGVRRECYANSLQMNRSEGKGHPTVHERLSAKYAANKSQMVCY